MAIVRYFASRVGQSTLTFFLFLLLIFYITRIMPGDPVRARLGPDATEEQIESLRHELGFDRPYHIQLVNFLQDLLLRGKAGTSLSTSRDALYDAIFYLPATLELATLAIAIGFVFGVLLGIYAATHSNKMIDNFVRVFAISGVSTPRFWLGILLQLVFAYFLNILPLTSRLETGIVVARITGLNTIDSILTGNLPGLISTLRCLVLPAIVLSTSPMATIARITRGSMMDESGKDYVKEARSNALNEKIVVFQYMLRNSITPALTLAGMSFGWMLGGCFVVETVFSYPGLAQYGLQAMLFKDVNAIVAVCIFIVIVRLVMNLVVDLLYPIFDPRIVY